MEQRRQISLSVHSSNVSNHVSDNDRMMMSSPQNDSPAAAAAAAVPDSIAGTSSGGRRVSVEFRMGQSPRSEQASLGRRSSQRYETTAYFNIDEVLKGNYHSSCTFTDSYLIRGIRQRSSTINDRGPPPNHHPPQHMMEVVRQPPMMQNARDTLAGRVFRKSTGECRYVIKHIRPEFMENHREFEAAASHLENEANIMTMLQHPHAIASLSGSSIGGTEAYYINGGRHDAYFLILEKTIEMLEDRIVKQWRRKQTRIKVCQMGGLWRGKKEEENFLIERLNVAYDIADALEYMHQHQIAYREFGLNQVGFNAKGQVQLIELGDAERLVDLSSCGGAATMNDSTTIHPYNDSMEGSLRMTASHRTTMYRVDPTGYTPPELLKGLEELSPKANVFSFTKVLSEMLTLTVVDSDCTLKKANTYVKEFQRISTFLPRELLKQLQNGISADPSKRPTMREYAKAINLAITRVSYNCGPRRCSSSQSFKSSSRMNRNQRRSLRSSSPERRIVGCETSSSANRSSKTFGSSGHFDDSSVHE